MKTIKILMLEDNLMDAAVILKILSDSKLDYECDAVHTGRDYLMKLEKNDYDIILSDNQLPDFNAVEALQARNENKAHVPFILITGTMSEDVAIHMIKEGANDYILKDRLRRLPIAIEKAIKKQRLKSENQSMEFSLSEITERFQLAAKTSFDVIWDLNIETNLLYCSEAIEKIIGVPLKENLKPEHLAQYVHPDDLPVIVKSFLLAVKGKDNRWRKIFRIVRQDNSVAFINSNAMIIRNKDERAIRMVGVMQDVTEVRRLQHELIEKELTNQRQIAKITIEAQEKERNEIGRELHDNVNQLLATAKMMIDTARNVPEMHDICLTKSQEAIMEAIGELRNLAHSMMPPTFDNNDFQNIIRDLAYRATLSGIEEVSLCLPAAEQIEGLNNQIKLTFYRILQEQISNILKYAKAKKVVVTMEANESEYALSIQDDGIGFNPSKNRIGIGLKNMESRCSLFNGVMNVDTAPGKGCVIKISIPAKRSVKT